MTKKNSLAVVILAAGKGTRMKSDKPKVMHRLLGLPMINWLLETVDALDPEKVIVVVGEGMQDLIEAVKPHDTVTQFTQDGTGSALKAALPKLEGFKGDVLVLLGDTPLVSLATLEKLIDARGDSGLSVLGVELEDPTGYGRLILDEDGALSAIREEKDASEEEKRLRLVNCGAFCIDGANIKDWVGQLDNKNSQNEYYITDLPEIAAKDDCATNVAITYDAEEVRGCNTRMDLSMLEQAAQKKRREHFIEQGVIIQDPSTVYFHHDTKIGQGVRIEPSVVFGPDVEIGENVHIKAFCHFEGAVIGKNTTVGPFARLRPGADIGEEVRIGNFVEVKKSTIGDRSKISHLGYVGDCIMGEDVNFGCGAITVNYDGYEKHQTTIGDNVMVGSNVNLIAPITVGDGAFVAAGSSVSKDVPADALSLERSEHEIRKGWAAEFRDSKT